MRLLGLEITRTTKAVSPAGLQTVANHGSWWPLIRESYTGSWQQNVEIQAGSVLTYFAVFACATLIASDIAKLALRLVERDDNGIWTEVKPPSGAAFIPFLRKPNRYQHIVKFIEQWVFSKLIWGNAYILKQRDQRGVVTAGYVLNPQRVTPLVAPDGDVYYQLGRDDLAQQHQDTVIVPAREIIHDTMVSLYHPLLGVSPVYACGLAATQGLSIQGNSSAFFANGSQPGGVLTAPATITQATADRIKAYWDANYTGANVGKVAVLGDGLKYERMAVNATDAQLIEQLKWTAENVCSTFHVPAYMIGVGPPPPYANVEPLLQSYYSQCLQALIISLETCLDEGLELPAPYGTEFDIGDLIWMDTSTRTKAAADSIGSGSLTIDEARKRYHGLGPVTGGNTPYLQQQMYSLAALAKRDAGDPFAPPAPAPPTAPPDPDVDEDVEDAEPDPEPTKSMFLAETHRRSVEIGLYEA